jgi:hypothetical protein
MNAKAEKASKKKNDNKSKRSAKIAYSAQIDVSNNLFYYDDEAELDELNCYAISVSAMHPRAELP